MLKDPELQCVLVTVILCEKELTSEDVGNGDKITEKEGLIEILTVKLEVIVPEEQLVKDVVGDWQLEAV